MPRKMAGIRKPKLWSCASSLSRVQWEICRLRGMAPDPAVGVEDAVEAGDGLLLGGAGHDLEGDVVEPALHVEGRPEGASLHPEDPEALVVGDQLPGGMM